MSVLIPLTFLIGGFIVIMTLLFRNLQRLDQEAEEAWRRVQEMRGDRLDAWHDLVVTIHGSTIGSKPKMTRLDRAVKKGCQANKPTEASEADHFLTRAWHDFAADVDVYSIYTLPKALNAIDRLRTTDDTSLMLERLYNNAATLYNNAGITFPTLLVAKHARFATRQLYHPQRIPNTSEDTSFADCESLADKSPRIMNAYMLWAVGMSDTTMEKG